MHSVKLNAVACTCIFTLHIHRRRGGWHGGVAGASGGDGAGGACGRSANHTRLSPCCGGLHSVWVTGKTCVLYNYGKYIVV